MVNPRPLLAAALVALLMLVPANVLGAGVAPVSPLVNGSFEALALPSEAAQRLRDSPLGECYGIGHQVFYGDDTVQDDLADKNDPEAAMQRLLDDPIEEVLFTAGYQSCVYSDQEGEDLVWLVPVKKHNSATHWSMDPNSPGVDFAYDLDENPFDREAIFTPGVGSTHNLWQAYPSPFQAFSADSKHLGITIEEGTIPDNAIVRLSLSVTPIASTTDRVLLYQDCTLVFTAQQMRDSMVGDRVAADPAEARFASTHASCNDLKTAWDAAAPGSEERRDILGSVRIMQFSLWSWNTGSAPVVIDDVALEGSATAAEFML